MAASFLLLYGSQTGQAQAIAEEIAERAPNHGLHADIHCLSMTEKRFWLERTKCAVIVSSTTGDGDPPDTVIKFMRRIRKRTLASDLLSQLCYTLLGLGDSNYATFCSCPKLIDKRLRELGAQTFYPQAWADDATGLEVVVDPWINGLWSAIRQNLGLPPELINTDTQGCSTDIVTHTVAPPPQTNGIVTEALSSDSGACLSLDDEDCLIRASPSLSESALSLPLVPPRFLEIRFGSDENETDATTSFQNGCPMPSAVSPVTMATIVSASRLTSPDAVKKTLKLTLDVSTCDWQYGAGDSIGIVCQNDTNEVDQLLQRLSVPDEHIHCTCSVDVRAETSKNKPLVPGFIHRGRSLHYIFTYCVDIRSVPKKAFLRALSEHCAVSDHRRRLHELCSKQGADDYARFIRHPSICLADVLVAFPSCQPAVDLVLEHLPRLLPRPYSAASDKSGLMDIVFNVVEIPEGEGRHGPRQGVCSGWLDALTRDLQKVTGDVTRSLAEMSLVDSTVRIPIFLRSNPNFRPPDDLMTPVIMVGPGTGVAPFIAFLQHRHSMLERTQPCSAVAESWLFYGCRHEKRDFLFRSELEGFVAQKTLDHLVVCFSRDEPKDPSTTHPTPRYVQDNVKRHGEELCPLLITQAVVFVCGDASNMSHDILDAFTDILVNHAEMSPTQATEYISDMRKEKRYLEDVWT